MKSCLIVSLLFLAVAAVAGPDPYDEKADARLDIRHALARAAAANIPVIIVFGANWCPDCRMLGLALTSGASAQLLAQHFKIVKVDLGQRDKNLDVVPSYGLPATNGIPTVAIVSPGNKVRYATHNKDLADARDRGDQGFMISSNG